MQCNIVQCSVVHSIGYSNPKLSDFPSLAHSHAGSPYTNSHTVLVQSQNYQSRTICNGMQLGASYCHEAICEGKL